jgi:hypothetical protein
MKTSILTAAAVALSTLVAVPLPVSQAHAQGVELEIGRDGPKLRMRDDRCDPAFERCDDREWRNDGRDRRAERDARRFCTEDRALDKAERMGIRRARVVSANRRVIEVRGRDRFGERVGVAFARDPRCSVLD